MKNVKRILSVLLLTALLCAMMATTALADEQEQVWLSVTEDPENGTVTALIVTNTTVTDGLVKLCYDADVLTYESVTVNGDCVAMHAVNPNEAGIVKISWVAPGAYTADESGLCLIAVRFTGTDGSRLNLSGSLHDAQGNEILLAEVDTSALEAAIAQAEALKADEYTDESWAVLTAALENAKAALEDVTLTQSEADAAAEALNNAIAALVKAGSSVVPDDGGASTTGDDTPLPAIIIVMVLCLVGIAVTLVILKRKGRKA